MSKSVIEIVETSAGVQVTMNGEISSEQGCQAVAAVGGNPAAAMQVLKESSDSIGQYPGLARPGACKHQQRTIAPLDGASLILVEGSCRSTTTCEVPSTFRMDCGESSEIPFPSTSRPSSTPSTSLSETKTIRCTRSSLPGTHGSSGLLERNLNE